MHQDSLELENFCTIFSHKDTLILGTGSPLRSDDAAGLALCELLAKKGVNCVQCEYGIENCIDLIANIKPRTLVVVDAAFFPDGKPGEVVVASSSDVEDFVHIATTHSLPIKLVLRVLKELCNVESVYFIGIYPKNLEIGTTISEEVRETIAKLADKIAECFLNKQQNWK